MGPQETIAHYRIASKLGEGGMGAVYLALDTKLGREVAIKLLPEPFASEPDRLARFAREAQVLAALNHPNIAAIYGVEESALVLELVPGPTLAERIVQGPIPFEEALRDLLPGDRVVGVLRKGANAKDDNARQIVVVLNWFEDLRRRVAGR